MSLSQEDIKKIVRDELTRIFVDSLDISFKEKEPELPTSKAWQALGFSSHRHLLKYVRNGFFNEGVHYSDRRLPTSSKPIYFFNIPKCKQWLNKPASKRN
jgi:hypothetical protein